MDVMIVLRLRLVGEQPKQEWLGNLLECAERSQVTHDCTINEHSQWRQCCTSLVQPHLAVQIWLQLRKLIF